MSRGGEEGEEAIAPQHPCMEDLWQKDRNLEASVNPSGTIVYVPGLHGAKCQIGCINIMIESFEDGIGPVYEGIGMLFPCSLVFNKAY